MNERRFVFLTWKIEKVKTIRAAVKMRCNESTPKIQDQSMSIALERKRIMFVQFSLANKLFVKGGRKHTMIRSIFVNTEKMKKITTTTVE